MVKGIIFDFDGLILDTETHQYLLLQELFAEYGSELPIERWQQEIGTHSGFSPFQYLNENIQQKIDPHTLQKQFKEKFQDKLIGEKARAGVEEYLQEAKEMDLKIGLASSSSYQWVSTHLVNLNIIDYFDCIKTSDDVKKVKPDPALYLETAKELGLAVEECLVFEDSANGAMAAKKAKMKCIIVPNQVTHTMDFCMVEHRLQSMSDMSLKEVIAYINK
ncbi:HAD-IA family hydrolase [Alkalihalophilus lindianensis]|uniref:HAD-IA family hydrolase n=1 Tax=Alkalihalophilus lindianensis TaxID=1630542 RepID=A0ABU3X905_9BACI|nr:HAD-IA family hydrolase [Alkalihalophilus lindianensis]MDV2684367.1 HAD-IA family hydrolase [Alkalihalophilus lindianensis]